MAEQGKKWVFGIGVYLMIKAILNLILGFSVTNIVTLVVSVVAVLLLFNRTPYIQYLVAGWLVVTMLLHLPTNLGNIAQNWIYLVEGVLDLGAAAVLVFEKNVKAFFQK